MTDTNLYDQVVDNLPGARPYTGYVMGLCPFHFDRRPSLKVTARGFKCLACGKYGNLKTLLRALRAGGANVVVVENDSYRRRVLPKYSEFMTLLDVLNRAHDRLVMSDRLRFWTKKRGIDDMIIPCQLGWHDEWYTFPITDASGSIVGGVARAGSQVITENKYYIPNGQPPFLYIPNAYMWRNSERLFITLGIIDAITLTKLGFAAATPTNGQYSVDTRWFQGIMKPIYVVPDKDEHVVATRIACALGWRGGVVRLTYPGDCKDPNDYLMSGRAEQLVKELNKVIGV